MNEMQEHIQIEIFIDELFVAIEEHSLLKANMYQKCSVHEPKKADFYW